MGLCEYLTACLSVLTGESWEGRVHAALPGHSLPVYQAAVSVEDASLAFDTLLKPFAEQRAAYRMHYQSKNSPELDFGAEPRVVEPVFADEVERNLEAETSVGNRGPACCGTGTAWDEGGDTSPSAADWVGPWQSEAIPLRHTFVHFETEEPRSPKFLRMPTY